MTHVTQLAGMVSKRQLSRWVAYVGAVALAGALVAGNPWSAVVAALLVAQYAAVEYRHGARAGVSES